MMAFRILVLTLALGGTGLANAQSTLGELLDRGAQKLTGDQLANVGSLRLVREAVDSDAFMTIQPDGTVVGRVHNKQGYGSSEAKGTWSADQTGKRCVDVDLPTFNMNWRQCGYVFRLGEQIYGAASDSDRSAPVANYSGTAFVTH